MPIDSFELDITDYYQEFTADNTSRATDAIVSSPQQHELGRLNRSGNIDLHPVSNTL